ncbi:MAG: SURF1 family protein [Rhodospirillales bacterium]
MALPAFLYRRFKPGWGLTLAYLAALGVLLALGTWQMDRMEWKRALIAERAQRLAVPPLALPAAVAEPRALDFRRVQAVGRFLNDRELYLGNRPRRGQPGYHVVTPLVRADGTAVLVNRGWVPLDRKLPESRADGQIEGQTAVQGIARAPPAPGWFTPKNQEAANFWFHVDPQAMGRRADLRSVLPVYIEAGSQANKGGLPMGGQTDAALADNHLQYALTWYALAVVLTAIYAFKALKAEE